MSYELYPLFSKPVYVKKLNIDCRKIVSLINKSFEQAGVKDNINSNVSNITSASKDKNVLANFAQVAKQAGADVIFKSPAMGQAIPFNNGIQMLTQEGR